MKDATITIETEDDETKVVKNVYKFTLVVESEDGPVSFIFEPARDGMISCRSSTRNYRDTICVIPETSNVVRLKVIE